MTEAHTEPVSPYLPPKIAVDAAGFYWRVVSDEAWSMCPTNPDNSPTPEPVTFYVPEAALATAQEENERLESEAHELRARVALGVDEAREQAITERNRAVRFGRAKKHWQDRAERADAALEGTRKAFGDYVRAAETLDQDQRDALERVSEALGNLYGDLYLYRMGELELQQMWDGSFPAALEALHPKEAEDAL